MTSLCKMDLKQLRNLSAAANLPMIAVRLADTAHAKFLLTCKGILTKLAGHAGLDKAHLH